MKGNREASYRRSPAITGASILFFLFGFGSLWNLPILLYVVRNRELPVVFGRIELMGGGFIEALGIEAVIASILVFLVFSVFRVLAGFWLWRSQKRGGILGLILIPLTMIIAIGWVEPFSLIIIPIQGFLLARGWKTLR